MLGPIETILATAIERGLQGGAVITAGPPLAPRVGARIVVHARELAPVPSSEEEPPGAAGSAWLSRRHSLHPDRAPRGNLRAFTLPKDALPRVEEVQSPPGTLAPRGDAYVLDGRTLRFAADQPGPIEVVTRGAPASGWHDRRGVEVPVEVIAQASDFAEADELLGRSVAHGMSALAQRDVVTLAWTASPGLRLRLLGLSVLLDRVRREVTQVDGAPCAESAARLLLRGELETLLATGEASTGGVISVIDTAVTEWPGDRKSTAQSRLR